MANAAPQKLQLELKVMDKNSVEIGPESLKKNFIFEIKRCSEIKKGISTVSFKLKSLREIPQMLKIVCSLKMDRPNGELFDGKKHFPYNSKRNLKINNLNMLEYGSFPMVAFWNKHEAAALAVGAGELHSSIRLSGNNTNDKIVLSLTLNAAFLHKDSTYNGTFHLINFNSKYGERDALARYYTIYPKIFRKNMSINPKLHEPSAAYRSWIYNNSEDCRLAGAGWEWCIRANRRSGDVDDSHYNYNSLAPMSLNRTFKYFEANGNYIREPAEKLSHTQWLEIQKKRLGNAKVCGVVNALYTCGLSQVERQLAEQFPDSIAGKNSFGPVKLNGPAPQDKSLSIFVFAQTGWGAEIRRMIRNVAKRNVAAMAFDTPRGSKVYRGQALGRMDNVSWDKLGPFISRGVANAFLYQDVRKIKAGKFQMGVVNNVNEMENIYDCFFTDTTMIEANPWRFAPPWPLGHRYAMGEKTISWWEGYHLEEFVPNYKKLSKTEFAEYIRGLGDYCARRSFRLGISYPPHFSLNSEYLQKLLPAFKLCNKLGWKIIPGIKIVSGKCSTARYGQGMNCIFTLQNISKKNQAVKAQVYFKELYSDSLDDIKGKPLVLADFYGNSINNDYGQGKQFVNVKILPHKLDVLESVAVLQDSPSGNIRTCWNSDLNTAILELIPNIDCKIELRKSFGPYVIDQRNTVIKLKKSHPVKITYVNSRMKISKRQIENYNFSTPKLNILYRKGSDSKYFAERIANFLHATSRKNVTIKEIESLPAFSVLITTEPNLAAQIKLPINKKTQCYIDSEKQTIVLQSFNATDLDTITNDFLNAVNRIRFTKYPDNVKILPENRSMFNSWRYSF